MGIHDRDYMKRPPEDEPQDNSSWERPGDGAENFLDNLVTRHTGTLKFVGIAILVLCLIAIVMAIASR